MVGSTREAGDLRKCFSRHELKNSAKKEFKKCFTKEPTSDIMFIDTEKSPVIHKCCKHPESHSTEVCFEQLYIVEFVQIRQPHLLLPSCVTPL